MSILVAKNYQFSRQMEFDQEGQIFEYSDDYSICWNQSEAIFQSQAGKRQKLCNVDDSQILPKGENHQNRLKSNPKDKSSTNGTSRKQKNKSAAQKYRQKRRAQARRLQQNVNGLQLKISQCQNEIVQVRSKVVELMNQTRNKDENADTYAELANCAIAQEPDIDKINLLLDTLKYRIGANGRERQAKIDYYFKQVVNTIFPALHRYLMFCAQNEKDIFSYQRTKCQNNWAQSMNVLSWTNQLFDILELQKWQEQTIKSEFKQRLVKVRNQTKGEIRKLIQQKERLKIQQETLQEIIDQIRQSMHPVQSTNWILFCQRHKYRRQLFLQSDFSEKQDQFENYGRKRVKSEQY